MNRLNLTNTALITLILSLLYGYLTYGFDFLNVPRDSYYERMLSRIIVVYGSHFILGWIIPFIPYGISLFINWAIAYDTTEKVFELFKILWVIMNVLLLWLILMEVTYFK